MADETWNEPGTDTATIVTKKIKEPDRYVVLLHNDDYTSMDFVVGVLCDIFPWCSARETPPPGPVA